MLLVSLDTVRWDHTSLSGYARDTTPSLAELAALPGATTFTRAYAPAAWSLPSYASILTGRDALSHGVGFFQDGLDPGQATVAEALAAYGYATAAFTSGPHLDPTTGLCRGFATCDHLPDISPMAAAVQGALAWLDRHSERPFFLFVVGYDAHVPYAAPAALAELYDPGYAGFLHRAVGRGGAEDPCLLRGATRACLRVLPGRRHGPDGRGDLDPVDLAHVLAHYDAAVHTADHEFGRLLFALQERGLLENTLVVALADHGEGLGEEGRFHHDDQVGDKVFHVPLVVRPPYLERAPKRFEGLVSLDGLTPTLLEYLRLQPPAGVDGTSFLAALGLASATPAGEEVVVGASQCCYQARDEAWSLEGRLDPHGPPGVLRWSLFEDGAGPDVAAEHPTEVARLRTALAAWPPHPGRRERAAGPAGAAHDQALRQALRRGGYWAPEPQEAR